jgi:DnaD/phage-associated family protein
MSGLVMGLVWEQPITEGFGRPEKYILLAYADHADQNGRSIYPSVELVSKKTGYEERSVQAITRNLEKSGFLLPDGMGPNGTNRWRIPLERTEKGGAKITPQPVQIFAPEGIAPEGFAPKPSVEVKPSEEEEAKPPQNLFAVYEQNIGVLTPMSSQMLGDMQDEHGIVWVTKAIEEAVRNGKRNLNYVDAILKRWKVDGYGSAFQPKNGAKKSVLKSSAASDALRSLAEAEGLKV